MVEAAAEGVDVALDFLDGLSYTRGRRLRARYQKEWKVNLAGGDAMPGKSKKTQKLETEV